MPCEKIITGKFSVPVSWIETSGTDSLARIRTFAAKSLPIPELTSVGSLKSIRNRESNVNLAAKYRIAPDFQLDSSEASVIGLG